MAPPSRYPWSLLWRAGDSSEHVRALVRARAQLSHRARLAANRAGELIAIWPDDTVVKRILQGTAG